jgi:GntR family transcriptional regulator, transcriptional repressor for pyruvate dehydrogenase complex
VNRHVNIRHKCNLVYDLIFIGIRHWEVTLTSEVSGKSYERPHKVPRAPKMAELVANDIRLRLGRGEMPDGGSLPRESVLSEQYGVSRPTMREAMRLLEAESLVIPRRGSREGALVRAPSIDVAARYTSLLLQHRGATYGELFSLRMVLEPPAAGMLATARDADAIAKLQQIHAEEEAALQDTDEFFRVSAHFHEQVIALAGLTPLTVFAQICSGLMERQHSQAPVTGSEDDRVGRAGRAHRAHRRFIDIIEQGDAVEAQEFWADHLSAIGPYYEKGSATPVEAIF